ncbi:MAG: triacylglycerol lipase [Pseudonocardiales bacterium]|nr:triacylglycerol lipase [Pseudonocardiales bacterium]
MLAALSPARRRLVVLLSVATVVAVLSIVAVTVFGSSDRASPAAAVPQDVPGPVLLVPGYGGSVTGLQTLAARLKQAGKQVQIVQLPGNGTGDLRAQARSLASTAKAVLAKTAASSLDVVGYSAGGVVARLWVRDYGGAGVARRVVTLGSPQHGTELATLGSLLPSACPVACQQLTPASTLLAQLNATPDPANGPRFVSIWSTADDVVLPPDSARLAGALNLTVQGVCSASTVLHSALPADPTVAGMIAAELTATDPVPLNAKDCSRLSS